jgi:GTP cyclohydrolase I
MCPHHLLPFSGTANVCYVPGGKIVGLNRIVMLVDCFTHRLELQERATALITISLMRHLNAKGAACLMESEHTCMTKRGVKREGARVVTTSFLGEFEKDPHLKRILLSSIKND